MSRLRIRELSLYVHLGCCAEERKHPQEIRVDVDIDFSILPKACASDLLEDTVCYAQICSLLSEIFCKDHFQTIEKMAAVALQNLSQLLPPQILTTVRIHKIKPPVRHLMGGVIFEASNRNIT